MPVVGEKAPAFCAVDQDENEVCLSDLAGKWVILYFYPKDDTPGCTIEARTFTAQSDEFEALGAIILGVSPDSVESHCDFIDKYDLTIRLLADEDKSLLEKYGALKSGGGVQRSTFLIDPEGIVRHVWPKVNVEGHADEVKAKLGDLQA
jgi:peroxiredoxin Q/BCP